MSISSHILLPTELSHKILVSVLAGSLHNVCVSGPRVPEWDMSIVLTLSTVCITWKDIVKAILEKAFGIVTEDGVMNARKSYFGQVQSRIRYLHEFGACSREPIPFPLSRSSDIDANSYISRAYALYLTATALRRNISTPKHSNEVYVAARESILHTLGVASKVCKNIQPVGLNIVVQGAIVQELWIVRIGTSLAEASISLESCLAKFLDAEAEAATTGIPPSQNPNQGLYQKFNDIQTNLHTALQQVERIFSTPCDTQDAVELLRQTVKTSGTLAMLDKYRALNIKLGLDEYDLKRRVDILVEQWDFESSSASTVAIQ